MRLIALCFLFLFPQAAAALCDGPSFFERLSEAELSQLDERTDETLFGEGLIWRATRGDQSIIVVGTMHIFDARLHGIFERVEADIADADVLLVEATAREEAQVQQEMASDPSMIFIADGPTLPERLEPELWDALSEASSARQIPPFLAAKMQPWYLALALAIPPCAMSELVSGVRGLDHMIMQAAEEADVPTFALEPYDTLLNIMRSGTFEDQIETLQIALITPEIHSEMFVAMLDAYFDEKVARVWEASRLATAFVPGLDSKAAAANFAETEQLLLVDRNLAWMPVIEARAGTKTVVAVGAAHLIGDSGILNLLEQDGWALSPH